MHSQSFLAVLHIIWFGPQDHRAQLCRALARARVLSFLISQMSQEPPRLSDSRNLSQCRLQRLGGGSHQPISSKWAVVSEKPTACLLACCCVTSLKHPWFRFRNCGHQLGCIFIPLTYALTHSLGHLIGSDILQCVRGSLSVAGLVDGVAQDLGVVLLAVIEHCWSLSPLGTVILGCTGGHVATEVGKLWVSHHSSVGPSDQLREPAKLVGNCGELPRLSWLRRSKCISFCVGLLGEHATVDFCSDHEHLAVHVRVILGQVRVTSSPGDSCWCSCCWGQPEHRCSHTSLSWECGIISKGKTCLKGLPEGVWECTLLCGWTPLWQALMLLLLSAPTVWMLLHGERAPH